MNTNGTLIPHTSICRGKTVYDAKWGKGFVDGEFFTKLVYKGVG
jgi:hypothetical protein